MPQEKGKKSVLLRLSPKTWNQIAAWAEQEFRSINGQIEYILSEALRQHEKSKRNLLPEDPRSNTAAEKNSGRK